MPTLTEDRHVLAAPRGARSRARAHSQTFSTRPPRLDWMAISAPRCAKTPSLRTGEEGTRQGGKLPPNSQCCATFPPHLFCIWPQMMTDDDLRCIGPRIIEPASDEGQVGRGLTGLNRSRLYASNRGFDRAARPPCSPVIACCQRRSPAHSAFDGLVSIA